MVMLLPAAAPAQEERHSTAALVSSITMLTSVTQESRRSRALASAGQRQHLLIVGAQTNNVSLLSTRTGQRTGHAGMAERFEMWSKAFVSELSMSVAHCLMRGTWCEICFKHTHTHMARYSSAFLRNTTK